MTGLRELAARLRAAERVTVMTGAGVSAASGVPTFRGAGGLWKQFRAEDLATPEAFARDPALVWAWYAWRRETIASCRPNPAHDILARWGRVGPRHDRSPGSDPGTRRLTVVTQNVDDLHLRAGTRDLVRLHGSIWELCCAARCGAGARPWRDERVPLPDPLPRCPHCRGLARPAVVWFGEPLREDDIAAALDASACDIFLAIGTSALVYPAAGFIHHARQRRAFTVEINPDATPATATVDLAIQGGAELVLPELDRLLAGLET